MNLPNKSINQIFAIAAIPFILLFCSGVNNFAANKGMENIQNKITDLKDGVYEFSTEDKTIRYEIPVKNGLIHGSLKEYLIDENSLASEAEYVKGVKEGVAINYYPDGTIRSEATFRNNIQDGETKAYYANGKLRYTMPYLKGVPHGNASMYDDSGNLVRTAVFKQGEVVKDIPQNP